MANQVKSRIEDGRIVPPLGMEVIVADHCNLACIQCNHGSPAMPKWVADPGDVARHLAILRRHYRPGFVKLIGGEPLLHPDLTGVIAAVRRSGIAPLLVLFTNGTLLDRLTESAWAMLDQVMLSRYAGASGVDDILPWARAQAERFGVMLQVNDLPEFRETFSSRGTADEALVAQVYSVCKLANVWGMHALHRGRLYKCPQSIYAPALAGRDFDDGFALAAGACTSGAEAAAFRARLLAFLNAPTPLASCRHCVGTCGKRIPHGYAPRRDWALSLDRPLDDLVDRDLLARSLIEIDRKDDCVRPTTLGYRP